MQRWALAVMAGMGLVVCVAMLTIGAEATTVVVALLLFPFLITVIAGEK